jgi:hypothetical protein
VPVTIRTVQTEFIVRALVDSGADFSLWPLTMAGLLGRNLDECEDIACVTASGAGVVRVHPIAIEAEVPGLGRFAMRAAFAEHAQTILLGRDDFFSTFKVSVDQRSEQFTLERYE